MADLVPRAREGDRREDDQHLHLRGQALHQLRVPDQAGLQEDQVPGR